MSGLTSKMEYLHELGIDCIWMLPINPSPLRDDGYDVSDFYGINPDYGTLEDLEQLVATAHRFGMRVIANLIPNHSSDQCEWFQASRDPQHPEHAKYKDWYVWSDTNARYRKARIIFLDYEESNWSWDPVRQAYYWHRFFDHQPDLNYDNPEVQGEMFNIVQFWLSQGVDGFRVDAVPYLFEREGTNCENLPETHAYLKRLRAFVDDLAPGTLLLSEANQWPEDVRPYLGDGDEFQMNFHFPLMPRIFMAMARGDRTPIIEILDRTPEIPDNCQWATFLRNHDELTLEMVTDEERRFMWDYYAPAPRMRINLGIRRRLAPLLGNDPDRVRLANSLLFTLPGAPVIYYGDEIGMGDSIWLDDRDGVRTPMQWTNELNAGFSETGPSTPYAPVIDDETYGYQKINVRAQTSDPESLLNWMRKAIHIRKSQVALSRGDVQFFNPRLPGVLAFLRSHTSEVVLCIHNLTPNSMTVDLRLPEHQGTTPVDLFSGKAYASVSAEPYTFNLHRYQHLWLRL